MEPSVILQQAPFQSIENEAFWKHHLESQKVSGLSRAKYCRNHQLDDDRFGYWIGKWSKQSSLALVSVKLKQEHKDWFEGFNGYLHVDGDHFFELVGEFANLVNCNAHARRKFEPIATQSTKGKGLAKEAMRTFKALYKVEREAKLNKLTFDQRYALRQQQSKPLMEQFKIWLNEMIPTVLPQSPLGKAMNYCIKLWSGLTRFLEDGRLEIGRVGNCRAYRNDHVYSPRSSNRTCATNASGFRTKYHAFALGTSAITVAIL